MDHHQIEEPYRSLRLDTSLPPYLRKVDGILLPREREVSQEAVPPRFSAELLVAEPPPWVTTVIGMESGRFGMRERFERAWAAANDEQREKLRERLRSCWSGIFGHRGDGPAKPAFARWQESLGIDDVPVSKMVSGYPRTAGHLTIIGVAPETGHVPVHHELLLYILAELTPRLLEAHFEERPHFDPGDIYNDDGTFSGEQSYTLHAWLAGKRFDADITAFGDHRNTLGCIAFLNAILEHLNEPHRFCVYDIDGEQVGYGPIDAIRSHEPE